MNHSESGRDTTEDEQPRGSVLPSGTRHPFLFVVLEGDRPLAGGARYSLEGIDELVIARGDGRTAVRHGRSLRLELQGRKVSTVHARLRRIGKTFQLEDADSTNGSYVNGRRVSKCMVSWDDVLELGRTFLFIREQPVPAPEGPTDRDYADEARTHAGFVTLLPELEAELARLERVASSDIPVVLTGETGTGKEVLSRALHALSGRKGDLIAVNCGALTESLAEAQLFGHVRGAFSGAVSDSVGFLRAADHGTLLLDEVQELRPSAQAALLRVLQEREVVPVGGVRAHAVDCRVIVTAPTPLDELVRASRFRPDLFARLCGFGFRTRPLRERREDLGLLVAALLGKLGVTAGDQPRLAPELALSLLQHDWSLNVRELEQLLRRGWLLARDGVIQADAFVASDVASTGTASLTVAQSESIEHFGSVRDRRDSRDLEALIRELAVNGGHVGRAAVAAGISRQRAHRLLQRHPTRDPR
jgi:DNA-binding NtrC family response regulator